MITSDRNQQGKRLVGRPALHITRVWTRHYTDNDQRTTYVEWSDGSRTECPAAESWTNDHMRALLQAAQAAGLVHTTEKW